MVYWYCGILESNNENKLLLYLKRLDERYRYIDEGEKVDIRKCVLYDFIYTKFEKR